MCISIVHKTESRPQRRTCSFYSDLENALIWLQPSTDMRLYSGSTGHSEAQVIVSGPTNLFLVRALKSFPATLREIKSGLHQLHAQKTDTGQRSTLALMVESAWDSLTIFSVKHDVDRADYLEQTINKVSLPARMSY